MQDGKDEHACWAQELCERAPVPGGTVDVDPAIKNLLHWMANEARSEHADADGIVRVGLVAGLLADASARPRLRAQRSARTSNA